MTTTRARDAVNSCTIERAGLALQARCNLCPRPSPQQDETRLRGRWAMATDARPQSAGDGRTGGGIRSRSGFNYSTVSSRTRDGCGDVGADVGRALRPDPTGARRPVGTAVELTRAAAWSEGGARRGRGTRRSTPTEPAVRAIEDRASRPVADLVKPRAAAVLDLNESTRRRTGAGREDG